MDPNSLIARTLHPFATLFGGAPDPRLGPDANRQAMRDQILTSGLSTIVAASQPGASALGSLAQGALAGRAAGAQQRERLALQDNRAQLAQLAEAGIDIPTARRMLVQALATGDMESAKYLTAVLTSMQAAQPSPVNLQRQETVHPLTGERVIATFDPRSGVFDFSTAVPAPAETGVYERTFVLDEGEGRRGLYGVLAQTGQQVRLGDAPSAGGTTAGGVQAAINRGLATSAKRANAALRPLDEELGGMLINMARRSGDTLFGDITRLGANMLSGGRAGMALTAGLNFINPAVRFLSGAQMNETEASRYIIALLPTTWDPPDVIKFKREMRDSLVEAMETAGMTGDQWLERRSPDDHSRVMELLYSTGGVGLFDDLIPERGSGS